MLCSRSSFAYTMEISNIRILVYSINIEWIKIFEMSLFDNSWYMTGPWITFQSWLVHCVLNPCPIPLAHSLDLENSDLYHLGPIVWLVRNADTPVMFASFVNLLAAASLHCYPNFAFLVASLANTSLMDFIFLFPTNSSFEGLDYLFSLNFCFKKV